MFSDLGWFSAVAAFRVAPQTTAAKETMWSTVSEPGLTCKFYTRSGYFMQYNGSRLLKHEADVEIRCKFNWEPFQITAQLYLLAPIGFRDTWNVAISTTYISLLSSGSRYFRKSTVWHFLFQTYLFALYTSCICKWLRYRLKILLAYKSCLCLW